MLIPQKNRRLIYETLFKEGVMVAKKDFNLPKHPEVDVPNLQVIKSMQVMAIRNSAFNTTELYCTVELEVQRVCQRAVLLEVVLLVPH